MALIAVAVALPLGVAPNPLRGLAYDTKYLVDYLSTISGPVVLVGHSYGGAVITDAATGNTNVKALVYDDAYLPALGETVATLSGAQSALAPASTVADTYLLPDVVAKDFAPDVAPQTMKLLTATQNPTSLAAAARASTS